MNLGFDSKRLFCNFTGLGNFSRSLVKNLQKHFPENKYFLYSPDVKQTPETEFFTNNSLFKTVKANTMLKSFWRSFSITKQLKKHKIELYHGLSNELPFTIKKSGIKSIVTIHDLIFKTLPETFPWFDRKIYDLKFRSSCQNADKIIAISHSTKNDIVNFYSINPNKIEVIYQSCNPAYFTPIADVECDTVLKKYQIPDKYILYLGSIEPRKNLMGILKAYEHIPTSIQIPIVVVGGIKDKAYKQELDRLIWALNLTDIVHWKIGIKENSSVQVICQNAIALIYPSFYEGFGLPIVEALLSKTPVISSNVSSLPEAGGPGSLYVNPENEKEIADSITKVLSSAELRDKMIADGYEYAMQNFSPEVVSTQLMECYINTLRTNRVSASNLF